MIDRLFTFDGTAELLAQPFVQAALLAAAVLGLMAGLLSPLIVAKRMSFAVHGTAELAFTGAAAALLAGISVSLGAAAGAVIAAVAFAVLGLRQRDRDSAIGVVLAFGLGVGVLLLGLHDGRAANKFGLLTGSIITVDSTNLWLLGCCTCFVGLGLLIFGRPLMFSIADPEVAAARGVPMRLLAPLFALMIGLTTAIAVPAVGPIMVLAVLVTPGAAATVVSANPAIVRALSILFAELALVGGTILSLAPGLAPSGYVATVSFACYFGCRLVVRVRGRAESRAF